MYLLTERETLLSKEITDCAFRVHKTLGPGLLESIYEVCFCHELSKRAIPFKRQYAVPIRYDGIIFDQGLKIDVYVDNLVICELKSVEVIHPVVQAQIISYLKLTKNHVGMRINFNVELIKEGIRRYCIE